MIAVPAREHAPVAELEDQRLALGRVVERRSERADAGILVAERKARLALVGRNKIETLEVGNVAPAARDLAVGHLVHALGNRSRSASGLCGD